MGDTVPTFALEISHTNNSFKLWGKEQVIVALSQTKEAKDTIFVENKSETINALVSLLKTMTQWTDYMDSVLSLVSINGDSNNVSISIFDHTTYPYRMADISLPECNTGVVY